MGSKRAVLWDMDGVLADSGELHYQSWSEALAPLSIPFNWEIFHKTFGMNNTGILTVLLGKPPEADFLQRVSDQKEGRFRELIRGHLQLLPGALQCLSQIHASGMLQAVASSAPQANIEATVDELTIRKYFSALVSSYSMPSKPDPAVFLEAARRVEAQPQQCIVVEDSVAGVAAAKKAGMKCIAVSTTHPKSSLSAADVIVGSLEELSLGDFR